jgi:DNA-directed RNA polymerase subunit K
VAIAMEEVRRGLLSFIIVRTYPNSERIRVRLRELLELERKLTP